MDELKDIVSNMLSRRVNRIEVLEDGAEDTLYGQFYEGIRSGKFDTDGDAAQFFYGSDHKNVNYKVLKTRFKDRLLNTMLFITPREGGEQKSSSLEIFRCYRQFIIARVLLAGGANKAALSNMKQSLSRALTLEQWDIVMLTALTLRRMLAKSGESTEYRKADSIYQDALGKLVAETEADKLQNDVEVILSNRYGKDPKVDQMIQESYAKINAIAESHPTSFVKFKQFILNTGYLGSFGKYEEAYKMGEEFLEEFLPTNRFYTRTRHANVLMQMLDATLHLRDIQRALKLTEAIKRLYREGTPNWFFLHELIFLIYLNTHRLEEASDLYESITRHAGFATTKATQQEVWKLFGAYLWISLKFHGHLEMAERVYGATSRFSISKLINETQAIGSDKRGINVAIVILQILFYLDRGDYMNLITQTDGVKRYLYKYLNAETSPRSFYFIKMVLMMEKYNFDAKITEAKTRRYRGKMSEITAQLNTSEARMEIMPYEDIWDMMLALMRRSSSR